MLFYSLLQFSQSKWNMVYSATAVTNPLDAKHLLWKLHKGYATAPSNPRDHWDEDS
jgi:hypothetical protein